MDGNAQQALEALKLLKDWSSGLVLVQGGIISVIGALLKGTKERTARAAALLSLSAFVMSIVSAANVLGSIPIIAEKVDRLAGHSIYDQPANIAFTMKTNCTFEAGFFVFGLIFFMAFAWLRRDGEEPSAGPRAEARERVVF